ncbi:glycosyltransferase family 2 protein [Candidatus Latescibacterota bacterium]
MPVPFVSVIVPAFNEEGVIEANIDQVADYLNGFVKAGQRYEVLVIDDGSTDSTPEILAGMVVSRPWLRTMRHRRNSGRGKALRTGFEHSRGDYVVTLDADLSYSPEHIGRMLAPLEEGQADVVLASPYHPEGSVSNVPFNRALVSRLGNKLLARAVGGGIRTTTCVVRAYAREVIDELILFSSGKDIHLEIIQKARILGFRVTEVPADLCWRAAKRSRASRGMSVRDLWALSRRHLFFNFLLQPSSLFAVPLTLIATVFIVNTGLILWGYWDQIVLMPDGLGWMVWYQALRLHMRSAQLSYFVWGLCFILLLQFTSLNLMSKQSNHHYEEMLRYISRLERQLPGRRSRESDDDGRRVD